MGRSEASSTLNSTAGSPHPIWKYAEADRQQRHNRPEPVFVKARLKRSLDLAGASGGHGSSDSIPSFPKPCVAF